MVCKLASCLAVLGFLYSAKATSTLLRGVDPAFAASYSPQQGSFTCLDGGSQISTDRLNDDYCDCVDGSDEPGMLRSKVEAKIQAVASRNETSDICTAGTSACALGSFFCRNRGHTPKRLNSSMVDDSICGELLYMLLLEWRYASRLQPIPSRQHWSASSNMRCCHAVRIQA